MSKEQRKPKAWGSGLLVTFGALGVLGAEAAIHISPDDWPWLAPAGLVYPLSVALLVAGMAWRMLASQWLRLIIPAVVLAFTFPHVGLLVGGGTRSAEEGDLRLMSWNVRQFDRYNRLDGAATRDAVLAEIAATDADVVCLQEVFEDRRQKPYVNTRAVKRAVDLAYTHSDFEEERGRNQVFGVLTLSRFPIVRRQRLRFKSDPGNGAVITDIRRGDDTLRIINAHLSSLRFDQADYDAVREGPDAQSGRRLWGRMRIAWAKRAAQAREVAEAVAASPHPVILCGDFNDTPMSYALHTLRKAGLSDAFAASGSGFGGTYIGDLPPLRIDYVLHSAEWEPVRVDVGSKVLSDHRALTATLRPAD